MRRFKNLIRIATLLLGLTLSAGDLQARTILSDAPFPWGTEAPFNWNSLNGVWRGESSQGAGAPLIFRFRVVPRPGGIFLVSSQVSLQGRGEVASGYGFVVSDQRSLNLPYFGETIVPLGVFRDYAGPGLHQSWGREFVTLTWVWDANNPSFVYQHMQLEKISNEPDL